MNKAKLKVLLAALKEVVDELESEVYSDDLGPLPQTHPIDDYEEVFQDYDR